MNPGHYTFQDMVGTRDWETYSEKRSRLAQGPAVKVFSWFWGNYPGPEKRSTNNKPCNSQRSRTIPVPIIQSKKLCNSKHQIEGSYLRGIEKFPHRLKRMLWFPLTSLKRSLKRIEWSLKVLDLISLSPKSSWIFIILKYINGVKFYK